MEADDVQGLLHRLTSHFAEGQVIFDCLSSFAVKSGQRNSRPKPEPSTDGRSTTSEKSTRSSPDSAGSTTSRS